MENIVSGIYEIRNTVSGKSYIGSAVNIRMRWNTHRSLLNRNTHHSPHLQASWNKYGADCFEFSVIEECPRELLVEREQYYIDAYNPEYNIAPNASSPMLGRIPTQEHKDKVRAGLLGKKKSPESIVKLSARMIGNQYNLGHKASPETIARMSVAQTGHQRNLGSKRTEETKAKMSASMTGQQNFLGKAHKQESKDKISAKRLAYWEKAGPAYREKYLDIFHMREAGETFVFIASKYGMSPQRAGEIYKEECARQAKSQLAELDISET